MITVNVKKKGSYPVSVVLIKKELKEFFKKKGIVTDAEVSVAMVNEEEMAKLAKRYLKEDGKVVHNVLSFPSKEVKENFTYPPDGKIHLGEIVVCYTKVVEEAEAEGKLVEDKIIELIKHGALHLLGEHHK